MSAAGGCRCDAWSAGVKCSDNHVARFRVLYTRAMRHVDPLLQSDSTSERLLRLRDSGSVTLCIEVEASLEVHQVGGRQTAADLLLCPT